MSSHADSATEPEIACTLTHAQAMDQLGEWADLVDDALESTRSDGHLTAVLPITERGRVEDLAARERACCSFLRIDVSADEAAGTVRVTVDSPAPSGGEVVSFIGRRP